MLVGIGGLLVTLERSRYSMNTIVSLSRKSRGMSGLTTKETTGVSIRAFGIQVVVDWRGVCKILRRCSWMVS